MLRGWAWERSKPLCHGVGHVEPGSPCHTDTQRRQAASTSSECKENTRGLFKFLRCSPSPRDVPHFALRDPFWVPSPHLPQAHVYSAQIRPDKPKRPRCSSQLHVNTHSQKRVSHQPFCLPYPAVTANQEPCPSHIPLRCRGRDPVHFSSWERLSHCTPAWLSQLSRLMVALTHCEEFSGDF